MNIKEAARKEGLLESGHRLCAGCSEPIVVRQVMMALRGPTVVTEATGCLEVATTIDPYTSWKLPWIHSAFENAAATATGMDAAYRAFKRKGRNRYEKVDVLAFGGDGATYDIGFQALSGAIERGDDFLYVLYDNEAYMNTGIQRSGGTPRGASTTTTPPGELVPGKPQYKKPIDLIIAAHGDCYVATASPAYWKDLIEKARRGIEKEGPVFLHTLTPCPRGWRYETSLTIDMARLAVETCYFPLWEYDGEYRLSGKTARIADKPELKKPLEDFLKPQGRFKHLFRPENREVLEALQEDVDSYWERLLRLVC
jgi:pyruvate ferredoxin oxidoreductase beta subunit